MPKRLEAIVAIPNTEFTNLTNYTRCTNTFAVYNFAI